MNKQFLQCMQLLPLLPVFSLHQVVPILSPEITVLVFNSSRRLAVWGSTSYPPFLKRQMLPLSVLRNIFENTKFEIYEPCCCNN